MNITKVILRAVYPGNTKGMKAMFSIVLDDAVAVHDIKVIEAGGKLFLAMPNRLDERNGRYRDVVHPMTREAREQLEEAVLNVYLEHVEQITGEEVADEGDGRLCTEAGPHRQADFAQGDSQDGGAQAAGPAEGLCG